MIKTIPHKGKTEWIDKTLLDIKKCLDDDRVPKEKETCDYCKYRNAAGVAFKTHIETMAKKEKGMFN